MTSTLEFAERAPAAKPHVGEVPIEWQETTLEHVGIWQEFVQPAIRASADRADRQWDWRQLYLLSYVHRVRLHAPWLQTAVVNVPGKGAVTAAMLFMLTEYPRIDGSSGGAVFTYFLSSAPKQTLEQLGVTMTPSLGRILVDCGIVASYRLGKNGHTWLHCSPKGEKRLLDFYETGAKLIRYPKASALGASWKKNDGRFFFTDSPRAAQLVAELDPLRPSIQAT